MRGGHPRDERLDVQLEQFFQLFGVPVGRRTIVAVIHPEHRNVRLHLRDEMQNHRFVRPEIRGDDGAAFGLCDGPFHDFQWRFVAQLGVGFGDLFGSHKITNRINLWQPSASTRSKLRGRKSRRNVRRNFVPAQIARAPGAVRFRCPGLSRRPSRRGSGACRRRCRRARLDSGPALCRQNAISAM